MLTWLNRLLRKDGQKPEVTTLPAIAARELWILCLKTAGPWEQKPYRPVMILDVRDGWVRYDMGSEPFRDERKTIDEFVCMYRRVTPTFGKDKT